MRIDTPEHMEALRKIVPLIPWGLAKMQNDIDPDTFRRMRQPTRATALHDIVFDQAEVLFDASLGITIGTSRGLRHFCLDDVLVRLRLGRRNTFQISVNRNEQTREWNRVPYQLHLDSTPDPNYRFHLVYCPDPIWTKLDQIAVGLYQWNEPKDLRELDVDDWYDHAPVHPEPILPDQTRPRLKLKTREEAQPLEGLGDGTAS